jgi:hypothetical protein
VTDKRNAPRPPATGPHRRRCSLCATYKPVKAFGGKYRTCGACREPKPAPRVAAGPSLDELEADARALEFSRKIREEFGCARRAG